VDPEVGGSSPPNCTTKINKSAAAAFCWCDQVANPIRKLTGISIVVSLKTIPRRLRSSGQDHAQCEADNPCDEKGAAWASGDKLGALIVSRRACFSQIISHVSCGVFDLTGRIFECALSFRASVTINHDTLPVAATTVRGGYRSGEAELAVACDHSHGWRLGITKPL
jgi:hypothetical protein